MNENLSEDCFDLTGNTLPFYSRENWRSKLARVDVVCLRVSGVTPGDFGTWTFHRLSPTAPQRRTAQAERDSLERQFASMRSKRILKEAAETAARTIMRGPFLLENIRNACGAIFVESKPEAIRRLATRIRDRFGEGRRPRERNVARFIAADRYVTKLIAVRGDKAVCLNIAPLPPGMHPAAGPPSAWPVRPLVTIGELASILNVTASELLWFADLKGICGEATAEALRHYRYRWKARRIDHPRLIEAPKQRLKVVQRWLLAEVLERIPPHEAAHGFRKARSVRSFTHSHTGQTVLLKMDLKDFFPSIRPARVLHVFLTAGYPEPVAELLAGLCTTLTPSAVLHGVPTEHQAAVRRIYECRHLPQGAPTSPALANLCAYRLDSRLAGLSGAAGASYTRYADDLLFSGGPEFARTVHSFQIGVARIAIEEGFEMNARKTRVMRQGQSQRAGGLVLNAKQNIARGEYDRLKAILYNCLRYGPESQNRGEERNFREHLRGRLTHFASVAPARVGKLWAIFEQIDFEKRGSVE